ncbi:M56 family metallopeptidase [Salinibacter ruber]|uniref:M56 family metallopeptidase n=1 Tax=Salinibacter ruber TaxID=146919 RepID=UPI0021694CBF|nr:M56 family metallopeptidase [Salinibacter ruber]MCS4134265.1 beta-lactamase regulating signal transducer with metallopeptidase domain/C-terminal processing protease CtpA/Prc [Salinibacter ruber]
MVRPLASSHLSTFLLDVLLKGAVLLLLAHVASALLRRWEAPASLRRAAWGLAFAALLALPIGQMVLPQSSLPDPVDEVVRLANDSANGPAVRRPSSRRDEPWSDSKSASGASAEGRTSASAGASGGAGASPGRSTSALGEGRADESSWLLGWAWGPVLLGVWGTGVVLLLARLLVGHLRSRRLRRQARRADAPDWDERLQEVQEQLGSGRTAEIRFHPGATPMSLGLFSPTILLPDSAREWPPERQRLVLLHEMAHLKHRDLLLGLVGQLGRALHWPNPLAWTGWSKLLQAREAACDETVLAAGEDPETYAHQLLAAARRAVSNHVPTPALQIARPTRLRERILAIVGRDDVASWPPRRKALLGTLGLVLTLLVVAVRPLPNDWYPRAERSGSSLAAATVSDAEMSARGAAEPNQKIQNLRAFATLYGYVRYFHPSDAAANTDWETFAVHGVRQVTGASSRAELRSTLDSLFTPIAPTIQWYETGAPPPDPYHVLPAADTSGLNLVAWQHKGLGLGNRGPYESARLHRQMEQGESSGGPGFGTVLQSVDATPHRGKQVRLRAAVRTDVSGAGNQAQLWLRVDRAGNKQGFFDNMSDRPITTSNWETYQITGTVAEDATRVMLGGFLRGDGTAHFDSFRLQVRDNSGTEWTDVSLENAGFETGAAGESPAGWRGRPDRYAFRTKQSDPAEGQQFLSIAPATSSVSIGAEGLFETRPTAGETITKPLGRGLSAQVPLALYSNDEQTLRPDDAPSPDRLHNTLDAVQMGKLSAADEALRLADVVIAWNVFQHFYPYFEVVDTNWDQVLTRTLQRAEADTSSRDFLRTLRRMLVPLKDGHGRVSHPADSLTAGLPLRFDRVEGNVVVADTAASAAAQSCARPGDVLTAIDGTPIEEALREEMRSISGSPQWRTVRALRQLGEGRPGTTARLELRREGQAVACQVARPSDSSTRRRKRRRLQAEPRPDSIDVLSGGTHYVDLTRVEMEALRPRLDTLAQAESVIFDVRGYPEGGNQELLQHLSSETLRSAHFEIPKIIYPDRRKIAGYTGGRWTLPSKSPQLSGEVAFLTDARAISYAESIMGIVEHYDLGTIVGRPTAGANGNVNPFTLPGQYQVYWTGMRVQKHDRSQHHLVGIRPDVEATRTVEGVRAGTDEVLRTALRVLERSP